MKSSGRTLKIPTAEVFEPLLAPAPYKGAYGGRYSGKSHFFAGKLVEDCLAEPGDFGEGMRAVCIREVQQDLAQSAKLLIESKLSAFGLGERDGFKVYREHIEVPGDGIMIFKGMNDFSADSIKSLEGFKRAWWEEAHKATHRSLSLLRPTIRAEHSEIWFSWNPERASDPVDTLLRGPSPPTGAKVVRCNWRDLPAAWRTKRMKQERLDCLRNEPEQYPHIWDGEYVTVMVGAYYAEPLAVARLEGRIGRVAADPLMGYKSFWDIGGTGARADACAIWVSQFVGKEIRDVDYYEAAGQPLSTHIDWMLERGYTPAKTGIWLPHDGAQHDKVHRVSFASSLRQAGYDVVVVPNQGAGAAKRRIEATRRLFPRMWFNEATTKPGLDALGWYHEKRDEHRQIGLGPEHDWSSHGADAKGLQAICYEEPQVGRKDPVVPIPTVSAWG